MGWENHFLDNLSARDLTGLAPALSDVGLERNQLLDEAGRPVTHAYFPVDSILSVLTVMSDGAQVESRTVGREGGYGLLQALGSPMSYERTLCQVGGRAWRMPLGELRRAAEESAAVREAIVRHAQASLVQAAQSTACNTLHRAEQRLCRWLLLTQDRLGGAEIVPLTQEHLAIMLGVQRTTVTGVASELQERGAISYSRGRIRILNRASLERCACECYRAIERGAAAMLEGTVQT
jgi:CRP-like cAMP-binding protein